jgi:hypothetical protein
MNGTKQCAKADAAIADHAPVADAEPSIEALKAAAFDWLEQQAHANYTGIGIVDSGSQGRTTIALNGASLLDAVEAMRAESEAKR